MNTLNKIQMAADIFQKTYPNAQDPYLAFKIGAMWMKKHAETNDKTAKKLQYAIDALKDVVMSEDFKPAERAVSYLIGGEDV